MVRVYDPYVEAAVTLKELQRSEFDTNKLSIVGKDYHTGAHVIGRDQLGDRMKAWCQLGEFCGGLSGLLLGSAFYFIPGIGPVIVFGPLVGWIVRAREGAVTADGLSALGAGLHSIGIASNNIMKYERALKSDKFMVVVHETANAVTQSQEYFTAPGAAQRNPGIRSKLRQRA